MLKFLFLDYRELEILRGFSRRLERPVKNRRNPLLIADRPWEGGNFTLYGSVAKAPDRPFQLWYTVIRRPWHMFVCYAESDDGLEWRRPLFEICRYKGRKTNIVLDGEPHGCAVIYDPQEQDENSRYKMVAGLEPSHCICTLASPDGIHWRRLGRFPVIGTNPDCPMGFLRTPDGRFVIYHRKFGLGRRVCRSESWNFKTWSAEPRMVFEPDAGDPPQLQFYGMGSAAYGSYEIGSLWAYHTEAAEAGGSKMCGYQETEFAYTRSGYAWHRAAQGEAFIPHGRKGNWEEGNLQCASQPVFLDDEIRYYYAGTNQRHKTHWELEKQRAGLGMASLKPDRFVALAAGKTPAELVTVACPLPSPNVLVNAKVAGEGWVQVDLLDVNFRPIRGATNKGTRLVTGNAISESVVWKRPARVAACLGQRVRVRVRARNARLYSLSLVEPDETPIYYRFRAPRP